MARPHALAPLLPPLFLGLLLLPAATGLTLWGSNNDKSDAVVTATPKPAIAASSSKQITAVISTLQDIISSINSEAQKEGVAYDAFVAWCKSEKSRLVDVLKQARNMKAVSDLRSKELNSTIAQSEKSLKNLAKSIDDMKDSIAKAETLRKNENGEYTKDMSMNRQSLDQVKKAIKIVGKVHGQGGFLQNGQMHRLRINEPGESSYVLGIMKGLEEKLTKTRKELEQEEAGKLKLYTAFMSSKRGALKNFQEEVVKTKSLLEDSKINLISATRANKRSVGQLAENTVVLKDVTGQCFAKAEAWKIRTADRKLEIESLNQAIAAVKMTAKSFFQESAEGHTGTAYAQMPLPLALLQIQERVKEKSDSVADAASEDGTTMNKVKSFKGPKGAVLKLVAVLNKEQKEEKTKDTYCSAELKKKNKEKAIITGDAKELAAAAKAKALSITAMAEQIAKLKAEVSKLTKGRAQAFDLRQKELKTYEAGSKDRLLAVKVLHKAIAVLNKFYATTDKTGLLQETQAGKPPPATWSDSTRKDTRSMTAIEMMDKVAEEIQDDQNKAAKNEKDSVAKFEKFYEDSLKDIDKLNDDIMQRQSTKAKTGVQMNTDNEEDTGKKKDLVTVNAQLSALHKECDDLLKTFDTRTKARTFEVAQLKDVMDILSGSKIAARTGFLQEDAIDPAEAALIAQLSAPDNGDGESD